jgi:hypothetical protein
MKTYWVYMMLNKVTSAVCGIHQEGAYRVFQHKNKPRPDSFTAPYEFDMLVWCEPSLVWTVRVGLQNGRSSCMLDQEECSQTVPKREPIHRYSGISPLLFNSQD